MPKGTAAIVPGRYDPVLRGDISLIRRSLKFADHVVVAIAYDRPDTSIFGLAERLDMVVDETAAAGLDQDRVSVYPFRTTANAFAYAVGARVIVREMATVSAFERGQLAASAAASQGPALETLFLCPATIQPSVSTDHLLKVAASGGDISSLVTSGVARRILARAARACVG